MAKLIMIARISTLATTAHAAASTGSRLLLQHVQQSYQLANLIVQSKPWLVASRCLSEGHHHHHHHHHHQITRSSLSEGVVWT
jgi:hypothetical protein